MTLKFTLSVALGVFGSAASSLAQCSNIEIGATDALIRDGFGSAVAISEDDAAVGAPHAAGAVEDTGAVYLFEASGGGWVPGEKLFPLDGEPGDQFGNAVALEGDTLAVGAPLQDEIGVNSGLVFLYTRTPGGWVETARLGLEKLQSYDQFGTSVAIRDGTLAVGAPGDDGPASSQGAIYVFVEDGPNWRFEARLAAAAGALGDRMGETVAISGDTIVAGAPLRDTGAENAGAAFVFERSGHLWTEAAELFAADGEANDWMGFGVAVEGETAFVGSPLDDDFGSVSGAVYQYQRGSGSWPQVAKLTASDADGGNIFGWGLASTTDRLLVSSQHGGEVLPFSGAAYLFERVGSSWVETGKLTALDGTPWDEFGRGVAIDGSTAIVGVPRDETQATGIGSAEIFELFGLWSNYCTSTVNSSGQAAKMNLTGTLSVAANDLQLEASQCPPGAAGLFLYAPETAELPFGDGVLCVGPFPQGTFRLHPPVQVDAAGTASKSVDLQTLPAAGQVTPGSSWNFQFWFRDAAPGGAGFNLSNAAHASFCP